VSGRIDVFFCHIPCIEPEARFRNYLARACLERWLLDERARVMLVQPAGTEPLGSDIDVIDAGPRERFHVMRYRVPERRQSEWYVVADDDCLPLGSVFVDRALAAAEAHPDYGVLAASDVVGGAPSDPASSDVVESHAVGGICFVSPRCPSFDFDVRHPWEADGARYAEVRSAGLREGRLLGVRMNHLGYGFSTAVRGHWEAP
jgi:hypothetical protein